MEQTFVAILKMLFDTHNQKKKKKQNVDLIGFMLSSDTQLKLCVFEWCLTFHATY